MGQNSELKPKHYPYLIATLSVVEIIWSCFWFYAAHTGKVKITVNGRLHNPQQMKIANNYITHTQPYFLAMGVSSFCTSFSRNRTVYIMTGLSILSAVIVSFILGFKNCYPIPNIPAVRIFC